MAELGTRDNYKTLLEDPLATVRATAAEELGRARDPHAIPTLLQALCTEVVDIVRIWICWAIGEMGVQASGAVEEIARVQKDDASARVREYATIALKQIGGPEVTQAMVHVLETETDAIVRNRSYITLGVPDDLTGVPALVNVLRLNKDLCESPRGDAAYALGQIGEKAIAAVPYLLDALREDPIPQVRQEVVLALGKIKAHETIPAMLEALNKDEVDWMRGTIAQVLADLGATEAITPIKQQLKRSINRIARGRLALALTRLEGPDGQGRQVLREMMDLGELESHEIEKFNEKVPQHPLVENDRQKDARLTRGWLHSAKWALEHRELDKVLRPLDQATTILKAQNNTRKLAKALYLYAWYYRAQSDYQKSIKYATLSAELYAVVGKPAKQGENLHNIGYCLYYLAKYQDAIPYFLQSIPIFLALKDHAKVADGYYSIGKSYENLGDLPRAIENLKQSLDFNTKARKSDDRARDALLIATLSQKQGDVFQALEHFLLAHSLNQRKGRDGRLREITGSMRAIMENLGAKEVPPPYREVVDQARQHFKAPLKSGRKSAQPRKKKKRERKEKKSNERE